MKTTVDYNVTISYNAGLLATDQWFATEEEARAFAEDYKANFPDCDKYYTITKYTTVKRFLKKEELTVERIESWFE